MSRDREPERDETSGDPRGRGYPLLFRDDARSSRRGLLTRILDLFRRTPDEARSVVADASGTGAAGVETRPPGKEAAPAGSEPPSAGGASPREAGDPAETTATPHGRRSPPGSPPPGGSQPGGRSSPEGSAPPDGRPRSGESVPSGGSPPQDEISAAEDDPTRHGPPAPGPGLHRATLQMLPGRLVPVQGTLLRQEIRFPRPSEPGRGVTLGWAKEDPPDHVTIDHPSVERHHASMRYRRGHWWIESLSADHPVLLNGRPVPIAAGPRHLTDGDRLRLGEVDFRFLQP